MQDTALILIDIQNDYFPNGLWELPDMPAASNNAARLLADARKRAIPVLHIRHQALSANAPFFHPNSHGADIHQSVAPLGDEPVIEKQRPNSFIETSLKAHLDGIGTKNLVLCGAMSQMCVDSTARAAVDLGYKVSIIEDACAAKAQEFNGVEVPAALVHAAFMAPLAGSFAKVLSTAAYLRP